MGIRNWWYSLKANRAQSSISDSEGDSVSTVTAFAYPIAYEGLEVVRRGTDLIVDSCSEIHVSIEKPVSGMDPVPLDETGKPLRVRRKKLETLLNYKPNEEEDINQFRRQIYMDLILNGNAYQYFDGVNLYHLPASLMEIKTGKKNKVDEYLYDGKTKFSPDEIIHTRDNSGNSIYKGTSRLNSARGTIDVLYRMLAFQKLFFDNGAIPGLIITTPNILSEKIKTRILNNWRTSYSPRSGARKPMLLDGDFKVQPLSDIKWKELDFENSVAGHETKILTALGVQRLLLLSGNNANISPNLKLFYLVTVLPLVKKVIASYERYFAYDLEPETAGVAALQPELRDQTAQLTGLVNAGIITINEARKELRKDPSDEEQADELRIPANIAGSARDPNVGGRPPKPEGENDNEKPDDKE